MRWNVNDPENVSEVIGLVYDSALEKEPWSRFMAYVVDAFPGFVGGIQTYENENIFGRYAHVGFDDFQLRFFRKLASDDGRLLEQADENRANRRLVHRRAQGRNTVVLQSRDLLTEEEFRSGGTYRLYCRPIGLGHWTTLRFAKNGSRAAVMIFMENERDPVEKDSDGLASALQFLSPHIVRAARFARALAIARDAAETCSGFMDAIALPTLITDGAARLQFANNAGQKMLDRGFIFRAGMERLSLTCESSRDIFLGCLRETMADQTPRGLRVETSGDPVSLCLVPFRAAMRSDFAVDQDVFEDRPLLAIFVGANENAGINKEMIQDVFDLSAREAEIRPVACRRANTTRNRHRVA